MFTIAPIGSCRIATPLRLNRDLYGYDLNVARNYGFCHSSSEAVQQLRFMNQELDIDPKVWPLVARGKSCASVNEQVHNPANLYVVEISSAKKLTLDGTSIQINYLKNEFSDFFENAELARLYWRLTKDGTQAEIDEFLTANWSDSAVRVQDHELLRAVRMVLVQEDDLRRDVKWIMANTPKVLFVTHVNALKLDGHPIQSRSDLIDLVTRVVREEGAPLYNPTEQMQQMGQQQAIEDYSDSLAHFTPEFCFRFFADWYDMAIEPAMDDCVRAKGTLAIKSVLKPNVDALLDQGRTASLAARLDDLVQAVGADHQLSVLQARVDMANDERELAYQRLAKASENDTEDPKLLSDLADVAFGAGDAKFALKCLLKLNELSEPLSSDKLFSMAQVLQNEGKGEAALEYLQLAISVGPVASGLAQAYVDLAMAFDPGRLITLSEEEREQLLRLLPPEKRLHAEIVCGARGADDLSDDLRTIIGQLVPRSLATLLSDLAPHLNWDILASVIGLWREHQEPPQLLDRALRAKVDGWYQEHYDEAASMDQRIGVLGHILQAFPMHREGRIELRQLRKTMVAQLRDLYRSGDAAGIDALAELSQKLAEPLEGISVFSARLALENGDATAALKHARRAVNDAPESAIGWISLLRAAHEVQDLFVLDEACSEILSLDDTVSASWMYEARARQKRLPVLALKAAREEPDLLVAHRLLGLAARDTNLTSRALDRQRRVEVELAKELREMAKSDAEIGEFLARARAVLEVIKNDRNLEIVLVAAGRTMVKQKDFGTALEFWAKAAAIDPDNSNHVFQRDRCFERLGLAPCESAVVAIAGA